MVWASMKTLTYLREELPLRGIVFNWHRSFHLRLHQLIQAPMGVRLQIEMPPSLMEVFQRVQVWDKDEHQLLKLTKSR